MSHRVRRDNSLPKEAKVAAGPLRRRTRVRVLTNVSNPTAYVTKPFTHDPPCSDPSVRLSSAPTHWLTVAQAHLAFDAVLFSAFLAGVKRTTGLTYVL